MNKQRYLLVVSGPSGCGKDTIVEKMIEKYAGIEISVSATTRLPRAGEVDGVNYHFLTKEQFEQRIAHEDLLEYANYIGNYYGTLKDEVDKRIEKAVTCVLVIEVDGASRVKAAYPECTTVFILPPNLEELEKRLRGRGSESEEWIQKRLERARDELALANTYDYQIVNDDMCKCVDGLYCILQERQAEV